MVYIIPSPHTRVKRFHFPAPEHCENTRKVAWRQSAGSKAVLFKGNRRQPALSHDMTAGSTTEMIIKLSMACQVLNEIDRTVLK
jgi:hypothetical protein